MTRIFGIIAALSALMVFLAGSGAYWFSAADAKDTETAAASAVANSLAVSLSLQLETLQKNVDGLAQSPDVIAAFKTGDPEIIKATAAKLQTLIPFNLRLRLLLPTVNDLDQSQMPHMGFGDLEMVRSTLTGKPKPVIQGDAEHRHLAITSAVTNGSQVIGVVLTSLKADLPQQIISKTVFGHGLIELKQDQLLIASVGELPDKSNDPTSIDVTNSRWKIDVWTNLSLSLADMSILSALIMVPALLTCLAFFVGYRKLNDFFHQDQNSILKAAKDMFQGKNIGNYSMQLEEMQPIIAAMAQFKRVMDQGGGVALSKEGENQEHDFFDESFDIDFLEETAPIALDQLQSLSTSTSAMPVSMPNIEPSYPSSGITQPPETIMESWDMTFNSQPISEPTVLTSASFSEQTPASSPFREYDICGLVGQSLTEELVANIGRAFASEALQLNIKTIVVGRDGRLSSPSLADALIKGILSSGCDVLDIGVTPTPVLCFVSHHSDGRTGVMVTGGQHPADHNGLTMLLNGSLLSPTQIRSLKTRIDHHDYSQGPAGSVEQNTLFSNEYIGVAAEDSRIVRPMTVVMDCANGSTGQLGPMLLKTIGCDVIELYCDIDGQFPNHFPDPSNPDNFEALIKAVKLNNADLGVTFDGAGECLGLVDSSGRIIAADRLMMLFARDVLTAKPASEIIYDAAASKHLPEQIKKRGGHAVLWKSGSNLLQTRMRETDATLAGDMDGHFLFNDRWFGFTDALYAAARMIEIVSADTRSSSELFDDLPDSLNTPLLQVTLTPEDPTRFVEQLFSLANFPDGDIVNIEGMRVEFPDGWGLIRASNHSPGLVLRFEASNHEAMNRIQAQFKALMLQIKPDISLPF